MQYHGDLYAKIGRKYLKLEMNSDDVDKLETENEQLKKETVSKLIKAREIIQKLLETEKENMYWIMNGSDKSSYFKIKKEAEEFIEHIFENEEN